MELLPTPPNWNDLIAPLPGAHILQTAEWAQVKARVGWKPLFPIWRNPTGRIEAAGLVLERSLGLGGLSSPLRVLYCPRGPLLDWADATLRERVIADLESLARGRGAIFLKVDPELRLGSGIPGQPDAVDNPAGLVGREMLTRRGWRFSQEQVQFRNTVMIDLCAGEEELLARMKQKTRYNIRLAEKKGVRVRTGGPPDFRRLYQMYVETSIRDGFVIRGEDYYREVWEIFHGAGLAQPLIAEVDGEPVAAIFLFAFAGTAWYLYGMSRALHRERMPNVLLQWEAMRWARARGCQRYDLWGAPDEFIESDPMWGVFRFKEGLGGQVLRSVGAWDYPVNPLFYRLYTQTLPRLLELMRRRGRARTREEIRTL